MQLLKVLRVGFDLDGVLNRLDEACLGYFKASGLVPADTDLTAITHYNFEDCLPGVTGEAVAEMFRSGAVFQLAEPDRMAIDTLNHLAAVGAEVQVVTARHCRWGIREETARWLLAAGAQFSRLEFIRKQDKAAYAKSEGLDFFFEDHPPTALALAEVCRISFLRDKPYNQLEQAPPNLQRFYSWIEVWQFFGLGGMK